MGRSRADTPNRTHRRGAIVIWAALGLSIVIACLAFSVDWGYIVVTESELQNAADAGALSGARALPNGRAAAIAAAQLWAGKNASSGESVGLLADEDVEIGFWDDDASFTVLPANSTASPNAVRVTCRRTGARGNQLNLFFAPILGTSFAELSATAIARIEAPCCGLIIGIPSVAMSGSSHTDSYRSSNGPYSVGTAENKGHVCSNGDITMSGSTAIHGDAHPGPAQIVQCGSSVGVSGEIAPLSNPLSFPPVDSSNAAANNDNSIIPLSSESRQPLDSTGKFELSGGENVDLPQGRYYFSEMTLSGGAAVRISGKTEIFVTGDVDLSGGSVVNLTLLPENLLLFPLGATCILSGTSEFHGVVYGPATMIERNSDSDYYGAIVAGQLVLSGSGGIHADESLRLPFLSGARQRAKLVQ